jgi:hypothetical protein
MAASHRACRQAGYDQSGAVLSVAALPSGVWRLNELESKTRANRRRGDIALSQSRHVAGLRTADLHLFNYRPCVMDPLLAAQAAAVGRKA